MIILVHYISFLIFQMLRNRKRLKYDERKEENITQGNEEELEGVLKFDPPLYKQRYGKVYEVLIQQKFRENIKKLVDFGCAEFGLFVFIKKLNLEEIMFVDIDESMLKEKIGMVHPLLSEHLNRRNCPLEVSVFKGSIIDPDYRLRKTDVVTAIELIEHLFPDTLEALPYNIFSFIRPKLVIITTPNVNFNVAFGRNTGFRHPDHKFEWTMEQFEDWCNNIIQRFPDYNVEISGMGNPPSTKPTIGFCTQAAVFVRKDLYCSSYISSSYTKSCKCCPKTSPCKRQTIECKLLCNCLCAQCLPDVSVGVCTYLSQNINENAYRPMNVIRAVSRRFSNTDLTYYSELPNSELAGDLVNKSYNIFYKLIEKVDYPYEEDNRTEKEKLLETFRFRINMFTTFNSRFYIEERERCEIPIMDLLYGDISISSEEARDILSEAGYIVEKCIIPETQETKYCIISIPQIMENTTSESETTEEYNSKSSECNENVKYDANLELISDWDDVTYVTTNEKSESIPQEPSSSIIQSVQPKNPDPLFDSGYLQSPSPLETPQQLSEMSQQDNALNLEVLETDLFDDGPDTPKLNSNDNKLHLKKTVAKEKFAGVLVPMLENQKAKVLDPNRVNELDRMHDMAPTRAFMNNFLRPQNNLKKVPLKDAPVAGTSASWKKSRKHKDKKGAEKKEPKEVSVLDDAKSLTECIIQNSLNIIEVDQQLERSELIKDLSPLEEINNVAEALQEHPPIVDREVAEVPVHAVENGDLANNNRDNEGNNLLENIQEQDVDEGIDLLNDNLEELVPLLADNVPLPENNNDLRVEFQQEEAELQADQLPIVQGVNINRDLEVDESVAQASREVLYDVNSEQDLLEDFDIPPQANQDIAYNVLDISNNVVFLGIDPITSEVQQSAAVFIQSQMNSFPDWLLQMLGSQIVHERENAQVPDSHDESHFYCQGDGVGVHPSIITVEVDEVVADDDSTEDTSSNSTVDYADADPGPSDMFDISSLPEESLVTSIVEDSGTRQMVPDSSRQSQNDLCVENGTAIVNEIVRLAEDEATKRFEEAAAINRSETTVQEEWRRYQEQSSSELTLTTQNTSNQLRFQVDVCALETSFCKEEYADSYCNTGCSSESEEVSNFLNVNIDLVTKVDSFNESDISEFFDSKNEES
ncbi:hypothetical protein ABEB36_005632 [Hypothenemus hampei]|uniref:Small RNA 2'-O-methyltransferase n=1 Tax=Hypothenemus hampei TaxID=57062 RepID=A0ABD1EYX3_HYPHA